MTPNTDTLVATLGTTNNLAPALQEQLLSLLQKQGQLADLQIIREAEEQAKKKEAEESARRLQLEGARAMHRQAEAERANQSVCSHRNDHGRFVIGGQRDHQHNVHYICLRCGKTWKNNFSAANPEGLPADCQPGEGFIGGPNQ